MTRPGGVLATLAIASIVVTRVVVAQQEGIAAPRVVEVMKIAGATEDISSNIPKAIVARDGRIAFFNDQGAQFVFFDSTGKRLGAFGRAGQGPGEFGSGPVFFFYTGFLADTLWVYDSRQRRFTLIAPDFRLVRTAALPVFDAASVGAFTPLALVAGGRLFGEVMIGKPVEYLTPSGDKRVWHDPSDSAMVLANGDGKVEKRVFELPANTSSAVTRDGRGGFSSFSVPYATAPLRDVSQEGDRFVYVTQTVTSAPNGVLRVTVMRVNGDTVFSRTYPFTGAPVTKPMADSALERLTSPRPGIGGIVRTPSEQQLKFIRDHIPSVLAPYTSVLFGVDGSIWLRWRGQPRQPAEYLVLDERGTPIAKVVMPRAGLTLHEASRTSMWASERDADGFANIFRFRLEGVR